MILEGINFDLLVYKSKLKAVEMLKNGLYSRFGLSKDERIEKAFLGCLGEYAFQEFLVKHNMNFKLDSTDFSEKNSDEFDFLIGNKKIDIKVAKKTTKNLPSDSWTYGYPQEQKPATKDFVIVGWIDFENKEIGFYGWIEGIKISKYNVVTKNTFKGYNYLTPNHEFRWGDLNKNFLDLFKKINN